MEHKYRIQNWFMEGVRLFSKVLVCGLLILCISPTYAQDLEGNKLDSINHTLGICFGGLKVSSDILELQKKVKNDLCDLHSCIIYYAYGPEIGIDSIYFAPLLGRIDEIVSRFFQNGKALYLHHKGGYSGGVIEYNSIIKGDLEIINITTPHTCVITKSDQRTKELFARINKQVEAWIYERMSDR